MQTFIINLKERADRKENISKEFSNKEEFATQVVKAIKHKFGAVGLWKTIKNILRSLNDSNLDYILICEGDHQFTAEYSSQRLFTAIVEAKEKKADILCGGVSWFTNAAQISKNLYLLFPATHRFISPSPPVPSAAQIPVRILCSCFPGR